MRKGATRKIGGAIGIWPISGAPVRWRATRQPLTSVSTRSCSARILPRKLSSSSMSERDWHSARKPGVSIAQASPVPAFSSAASISRDTENLGCLLFSRVIHRSPAAAAATTSPPPLRRFLRVLTGAMTGFIRSQSRGKVTMYR